MRSTAGCRQLGRIVRLYQAFFPNASSLHAFPCKQAPQDAYVTFQLQKSHRDFNGERKFFTFLLKYLWYFAMISKPIVANMLCARYRSQLAFSDAWHLIARVTNSNNFLFFPRICSVKFFNVLHQGSYPTPTLNFANFSTLCQPLSCDNHLGSV